MRSGRHTRCLLFLLILLTLPVVLGCEGSEPRDQVDDTVREVSGQKNLERMEDMKEDIEVIQGRQAERLDQLEESGEE